jgi:hypothetical protein
MSAWSPADVKKACVTGLSTRRKTFPCELRAVYGTNLHVGLDDKQHIRRAAGSEIRMGLADLNRNSP